MITDLQEAKETLDALAEKTASTKRLTRSETREILRSIYSIRLSEGERGELLEYIKECRKKEGANRVYVEKASNEYTLPVRHVFPTEKERTNVSRYSCALAELDAQGVEPDQFFDYVNEAGGLTDLYWQHRFRVTKVQRRAKLTLDRAIVVDSGTEVVLRLMPKASGVFKVLSVNGKAA